MNFEWDTLKASSNFEKHKVTFGEAATVFGDPLSFTFYDPDHSSNENRFITIGMSKTEKIIIVSHTDRKDNIRIISARKATAKERRFYEKNR
ncbi:MAG: BrnT family toxin [Ignavibacteria bacterium]|jgi:uncharacterized DUF497 family protein